MFLTDKLETSKRTDLHFLTTAELESWIILMMENFVQLKRSAQQFVLKFIGLISQNVNCFLLLQSHAVFDMFYHMFLAQDFTFRSLFVKTLNFLLSHKEGRCYVTQASGKFIDEYSVCNTPRVSVSVRYYKH
jgi:hypothetical protein